MASLNPPVGQPEEPGWHPKPGHRGSYVRNWSGRMAMIGARARVVSLLVSQIVARESRVMPTFYPIRRWLHGYDLPASVGQTVVGNLPARVACMTIAASAC